MSSPWIPAGTGKGSGFSSDTPMDSSAVNSYTTDANGLNYDQNGYVQIPKSLYSNQNQSNPYTQGYANAENAAATGIPQAQSNIRAWGQKVADLGANSSSGYPAMENAYGLGSTSVPGAASGSDYGADPITVTVPDTASRGFNPWSLTGESNARGKS